MGLGTGIYCKFCDIQLYYGEDTEEIVSNQCICHKCSTIKKLLTQEGGTNE